MLRIDRVCLWLNLLRLRQRCHWISLHFDCLFSGRGSCISSYSPSFGRRDRNRSQNDPGTACVLLLAHVSSPPDTRRRATLSGLMWLRAAAAAALAARRPLAPMGYRYVEARPRCEETLCSLSTCNALNAPSP
eukprot:1286775-Pleurochrysis_carterae.AAC.1